MFHFLNRFFIVFAMFAKMHVAYPWTSYSQNGINFDRLYVLITIIRAKTQARGYFIVMNFLCVLEKNGVKVKKAKYPIVVFAILSLSFIIRCFYLIMYPVPARDSYIYLHFLHEWENTNTIPISETFPPIAMMFFRFPHQYLGCELVKGGILLNCILGLFIVYFICQATKRITKSNLCVLLVGGLAATNPSLVRYSCQFLRENIYLFFCSLCVKESVEIYYKYSHIALLKIAFFSVLSCFSRHEGYELFLLEIIFLLFLNRVSFSKKIKIIFLYCTLYAVCFGLLLLITGIDIDYFSLVFDLKQLDL